MSSRLERPGRRRTGGADAPAHRAGAAEWLVRRAGGPRPPAALIAVAPWLVARVVVGLVLLLSAQAGLRQAGDARDARGLWVWDAAWYREIAEDGYGNAVEVRFFPLLPLLGRAGGVLLGGRVGLAMLVLSGLAALVYAALLVRLVRFETGEEGAARRAAWWGMLAPGAAVLVLAYTEPVAGALAAGFFLALRGGLGGGLGGGGLGAGRSSSGGALSLAAPLAAVPLGLLSGLARPTGVLLVAPALVEAWRAGRAGQLAAPRARLAWLAAVASPAVGTGLYGAWVAVRYGGNPLLPYTIQTVPGLRGGVAVDPSAHLFTTIHHGLDWRLQLGLLVAAVALLVVVARRLPASYAVWSGAMLFVAVTSAEGHSVPRYVASTFPLLLGAALVCKGRWWPPALLASIALFGYVAFIGFTPDYVL